MALVDTLEMSVVKISRVPTVLNIAPEITNYRLNIIISTKLYSQLQ